MSKEKQIRWLEDLAEDVLEQYTDGYSRADKEMLALALYNIGCRKKTEWISVDERLPEKDGMYLVYYKERSKDDIRITFFRNGEKYYNYMWKRHYSHWMPLPEAPKMKGGAE